MRELGAGEAESCDELVVAGEERLGTVQNGDSPGPEASKPGDPGLDAVERGPDVEVGEDEVALRGPPGSLRRRDHGRLEPDPAPGGDKGGGDGRVAPRDDEQSHRLDPARGPRVHAGKIW